MADGKHDWVKMAEKWAAQQKRDSGEIKSRDFRQLNSRFKADEKKRGKTSITPVTHKAKGSKKKSSKSSGDAQVSL